MYANDALDLPTYADAYAASCGDTVISRERVGTAGASVISFKRPPGSYPGTATSDFALMMVHNGVCGAEFDLGMGRFALRVAPGQLFLAPPFTPTENSVHGIVTGVVLALGHAKVAELLHDLSADPHTLFRNLYSRPVCDDFIRVAINQLLVLARARMIESTLIADGAILAIFAALAGHGTRRSGKAKRGLADWQLRRVVEKLESLRDVSVAELAASANLSPFYFSRAFKQTTGVAPHHFQQRVRIERAKELLAGTALSITEIALSVGYESSQTLARVFRKNVGTTPAAYRRCIAS